MSDPILRADGFDDAIIGQCMRTECIIYDYDKCIDILTERDGMTHEDALDYMGANVTCAYVGKGTPIFMSRYFDNGGEDKRYDPQYPDDAPDMEPDMCVPCEHYEEDPCIAYSDGTPKGQCLCGFKEEEHAKKIDPLVAIEDYPAMKERAEKAEAKVKELVNYLKAQR